MSIKRKEISNVLPNGILEDAILSPEDAGLAVKLSGFYTAGELRAVLEDLVHLDNTYQASKNTMSRDAITDNLVVLLKNAGAGERDRYLVYCFADPDLTVEITKGFIVAKIKGRKIPFTGDVIDRARAIVENPIFDYK
jgi:hypothetical protein